MQILLLSVVSAFFVMAACQHTPWDKYAQWARKQNKLTCSQKEELKEALIRKGKFRFTSHGIEKDIQHEILTFDPRFCRE